MKQVTRHNFQERFLKTVSALLLQLTLILCAAAGSTETVWSGYQAHQFVRTEVLASARRSSGRTTMYSSLRVRTKYNFIPSRPYFFRVNRYFNQCIKTFLILATKERLTIHNRELIIAFIPHYGEGFPSSTLG